MTDDAARRELGTIFKHEDCHSACDFGEDGDCSLMSSVLEVCRRHLPSPVTRGEVQAELYNFLFYSNDTFSCQFGWKRFSDIVSNFLTLMNREKIREWCEHIRWMQRPTEMHGGFAWVLVSDQDKNQYEGVCRIPDNWNICPIKGCGTKRPEDA